MVAFAFEWTKTLPGPLALASLEHKLLFWVDTVGGVRRVWAGGRHCPVTTVLTSPCSPDHPAVAGEDRAGSRPESLPRGPRRRGGPSTALGETRAAAGHKGWVDGEGLHWAGEGGAEVTLSLSALSPVPLPLPPLPLWHQCPTRWYWKLVPVSGAVSPPRLPASLVAWSVCLFCLPVRSVSYLLPAVSRGYGTPALGDGGNPSVDQEKRGVFSERPVT